MMKKIFLFITIAIMFTIGLSINVAQANAHEADDAEQVEAIDADESEQEVVEKKTVGPEKISFHDDLRRKINTMVGYMNMVTYEKSSVSFLNRVINVGIYVTYALIIIAAFTAVVFPIFFFVKDLKKAKGTLIGLAVLLIVVLISYAIATGNAYEEHNVGSTVSRWVGAGIISTFVLAGLGVVAAVYTEVSKLLK